ncbi:MAG: MotA/TolQ/ExbB proton channel family protein [Kiritimatiellae bacterium]|nr:MotA/TolQ/ExbB proton channel family protein [Kiritimatiellia bacterium]
MSVWTMVGGPVFWLLALLGAASVFIFFSRLLNLRRAQIDYQDFIRGVANVLTQGNPDEALAICDDTPAPVARIVAAAIRHREGSVHVLRETVDTTGRAEVSRLERRLALLAIIAQAAPLLGLLGTILGMMRVVLALNTEALVTRVDLLGGTMQTLVAAAAGLVVAVSVQVMYGMLHIRLERLVVDLEAAASEILALLANSPREEPA